jgi:tight adherence protein C
VSFALLCGAGVGAGLWAVARGLAPPRLSLAQALDALRRPAQVGAASMGSDAAGLAARAGRPIVSAMDGVAVVGQRISRDLRVIDRPLEVHAAEKVALGLFGLVLAPGAAAVLALGGVRAGWWAPAWTAIVLAAIGFFTPDLGVHAEAERRRADFRHALAAFLDLVVIALAGGAGVEGALADAADTGSGWAFLRIRQSLGDARVTREPSWVSLGRLGEELGIDELGELAASAALAGTEGAKVRASLAAKAASLRSHQLAESETAAQAATERMSLPVVLLFAGFLIFVGYPAIAHVLEGL